ncbi:hypothetical protein [Streptomyces sp. NPDC006610]|jgi:hypothetical protein|uniref:hypothetical protein n=1 Tax=Streptomyces sp. NPDC006610 TaxID=3154584 RepID=UPI0033A2E4C2
MGKRMLRSVLVASFSAAAALGVLAGFSGGKVDVRADTRWPVVAESADTTNDTSWPSAGSGATTNDTSWPGAGSGDHTDDTSWPVIGADGAEGSR